jgi:S-formylglutathione hydrolase FrmB
VSLTGWPFLVAVVIVTVAVLAGTVMVWNRLGSPWLALSARATALLLVLVCGGLLTVVEVNRQYTFYATMGELFGHPEPPAPAMELTSSSLPLPMMAAGHRAAAKNHGTVFSVRLPGRKSGISRDGEVYLPAAYFSAAGSSTNFPVIEFFHGYPGIPGNWTGALHLGTLLDTEISAGRIPPLIAVVPAVTAGGSDTECVNAVGGEQDETYLTVDVPEDLGRAFRILPAAGSWAAAGISMGGYCALNLALRNPWRYRAAGSLSGYATADPALAAHLFRGDVLARYANSPAWWAQNRAVNLPALYLVAGTADHDAVTQDSLLQAALANRTPLTTVLVPGGHNFKLWAAATPPMIDWIASFLPAPVAPPLTQPGAQSLAPAATPPTEPVASKTHF